MGLTPDSKRRIASPILAPTGSGLWFLPQENVATGAPMLNELRVAPLYLPFPATVTSMCAEFTAAGSSGSALALAIFNDSGNFSPAELVVTGPIISTGTGNAGNVSTGGTPGQYAGSATGNPLPEGLYWIGGMTTGNTAATVRTGIWLPYSFGISSATPSAGVGSYGGVACSVPFAQVPGAFLPGGSAVTSDLIPRVGLLLN